MENNPLECIGFAIGEWIEAIKAWDPMALNGGAAIQPDYTTDYLRLDAKNRLYSASHNDTLVCSRATSERRALVSRRAERARFRARTAHGAYSFLLRGRELPPSLGNHRKLY